MIKKKDACMVILQCLVVLVCRKSFEYFPLYTNWGCLHTNIKICNIVNFQKKIIYVLLIYQ